MREASTADRGGRALPVQADGLQGRVRGRAAAHRPGLPGQGRGAVRRRDGKDYKLAYHLAPPLIAKQNAKGELQKQRFGPWMLSAFRRARQAEGPARHGVRSVRPHRGAPRRARADRANTATAIDELLRGAAAGNLGLATEIARIPEEIRGYGHVKERHLAAARPKWDALMAAWRAGTAGALAAGSRRALGGARPRHPAARGHDAAADGQPAAATLTRVTGSSAHDARDGAVAASVCRTAVHPVPAGLRFVAARLADRQPVPRVPAMPPGPASTPQP